MFYAFVSGFFDAGNSIVSPIQAAGAALMNFLLFVAAIAMIVPIGGLAWEFLIKRG